MHDRFKLTVLPMAALCALLCGCDAADGAGRGKSSEDKPGASADAKPIPPVPLGWQPYDQPSDYFKVYLPGPPDVRSGTEQLARFGTVAYRAHNITRGEDSWEVTLMTLSNPINDEDANSLFRIIRQAAQATGKKILTDEQKPLLGRPGLVITMQLDDAHTMQYRWVFKGIHIWRYGAKLSVVPTENTGGAPRDTTFFDSFQLVGVD